MTSTRYGTRPALDRARARAGRAMLVLALALGGGWLTGCRFALLPQRADVTQPAPKAARQKPAQRSEKPRDPRARDRRTPREDPLAEALGHAALDPKQPYWAFRAGQLYAGADSLARAEAWLRTALARDGAYAPALALLSKLYWDAGRHEEGVRLLESARARTGAFPEGFPPELLAGLALHYDALDRTVDAEAAAAEVARPDPDATGSALVYVRLRGRSPESAASLAEAALDRDGKSAVRHNNLGIARLRAGDPVAARKSFLKAIDLDPRLPGPYYNLAILEKYYALDDLAGARWFAEYRRRSSDDPDGLARAFDREPPAPVTKIEEKE